MKKAFSDKIRLVPRNKKRLEIINEIIEEYSQQGYKLTLRQLYYQLVTRNIIPNKTPEYAKLSHLLVEGRMGGIVDWNAIEDRIRVPFIPYFVEDVNEAMEDTITQYRYDRLRDQDVYIEVWVEKDALSGVLKRITNHYHVKLMVNRGYSSCTAMYDASKRFMDKYYEDKKCHILYLGDHDPSGLDMVRDIKARLEEFQVEVDVKAIALTQAQIKQYNPPPNPAKFKDPRINDYVAKFGRVSWEVDALNPATLHGLLKQAIEELIDVKKFNALMKEEEKDRKKLRRFKDSMEE